MSLELSQLQTAHTREQQPLLSVPLSLRANPGTLWVLAGRNGAGKSTLLNTVCGLISAYSGAVKWNGMDVQAMDPVSRSAIFALVFTARPAAGSFTAHELTGTALFRSHDLNESARDERIQSALETAGAAAFAHRLFGSLSDGEKQKVLLARALAQDTPVLLLDEPSAFLDFAAKRELAFLLKKLTVEQGKLTIVSTHDTEVFLPLADYLLFLQQNGPAQLIEKPAQNAGAATLFAP